MFVSFNYIQIQCEDCNKVSHFEAGNKYVVIECPFCRKEKDDAKPKSRRKSTKNTKEV